MTELEHSAMGDIHTRTNKQLEFNLGTFNIPTVVGLLTIIGMIWAQSAERTKKDADIEFRVSSIEKDRTQAKAANEARWTDMQQTTAVLPNLNYRLTVQETSLGSANSRIDRGFDAIDGLRSDIAGVSTKLEVLNQRIELLLPRTELGNTPRDLKTRN